MTEREIPPLRIFNLDDYPLRGAGFEAAFVAFLGTDPQLWWLSAQGLETWPLDSEAVERALIRWSRDNLRGRAHFLAKDWRYVEAECARFMNWRRLFAHQCEVRAWPKRMSEDSLVPRGLFSRRHAIELAPPMKYEGLFGRELADTLAIKLQLERLEAFWGNSIAALPAYRLGL